MVFTSKMFDKHPANFLKSPSLNIRKRNLSDFDKKGKQRKRGSTEGEGLLDRSPHNGPPKRVYWNNDDYLRSTEALNNPHASTYH